MDGDGRASEGECMTNRTTFVSQALQLVALSEFPQQPGQTGGGVRDGGTQVEERTS